MHKSTSPSKQGNTNFSNETPENTDGQSAIIHAVFGHDNTKGALQG